MTLRGSAAVRARVRRLWRGETGIVGRALGLLLLPSEILFRVAVALRSGAYRWGWLPSFDVPIPVLSVGNLTVGGTGKTPVVGWLVRELEELRAQPAIVTRGYGGDELLLHRRWNPRVAVHTDPDRVAGARAAAREGARIAVLDDGFQHRRLRRDADWVLVSAEQPRPARLLPRGPYRESPAALGRATLVAVTRKEANEAEAIETAAWVRRHAPDVPLARLRLEPAGWSDLLGTPRSGPGEASLAVAGIGEPETFLASARAAGCPDVPLMTFPDHHSFTAADAVRIRRYAGGGPIVTTEKDAVRLAPLADALPEVRVLHLRIVVEEGEAAIDAALDRLASAARAGGHP